MQVFAIAIGGAFGAVFRYGMSNGVHSFLGRGFPYGTLSVNVLGSLLMGFLYILFLDRITVSAEWRAVFQIGLLGAFTTFSTFSIETLLLLENGEAIKAGLNIFLSIGVCLLAAWLGMLVGRQI